MVYLSYLFLYNDSMSRPRKLSNMEGAYNVHEG